jgi:hypothetical protein
MVVSSRGRNLRTPELVRRVAEAAVARAAAVG